MEQELQLDEINQIKDIENKLIIMENDIRNFELNFHKKNQKKVDSI